MFPTRSWYGSLLLVPFLLVAACGAPEEGDTMAEMEEAAETEATAETEMAEEMAAEEPAAFTATLETLNESGVTGTATATHDGESVIVEVQVQGVTASGDLPAHIHEGECAAGGSVLVPLTSVTVTEGTGTATTTLTADQLPADQAASIRVHDPEGTPVACGNLEGHGSQM